MEGLFGWKDPLFVGLWHSSWQASVLIGLVLLLQWSFGNKLSPGWRYGLWLLVVIRLALPVTPESPLSIFNVSIFDGMRFSRPGTPSFENFTATPIVSPVTSKHRNPPTLASQHSESLTASPQASRSSFLNLMFKPILMWISSVWILGALLQAVRICFQNARFANRVKCNHREVGSELVELFEECKGLMQIRHHITLLETPQVRSPALYGLFRPILLLPENLIESFSREELRYVLLHELAHVKRSDMAVNWLMTVVQVMHWFNPLVWFALSRMRADREQACDAIVLSQPNEGEAFNYGATLIKLLEGFGRPAPSTSLMGILQDKNQIHQRIRTIANFKAPSSRSAWAALLLVGVGCVGLTDARTPNAAYPVSSSASGDKLQAREQTQLKNAPSSVRVAGNVIYRATTKATPVEDLTRSAENRPTNGPRASSMARTTKVEFIPISSQNGDLPNSNPVRTKSIALARTELGGMGGVSASRSARPTNAQTMGRKSKNQEPRISITDRFPIGALHLILPSERLSATQNVAPEFNQPRVPLSLAQNGDAPSQFATIRIRPDRTSSVQ